LDTDHWRAVTVSLAYRLGEIRLFSRTFSGAADARHFTTIEPYAALPNPDAELSHSPHFVLYPTYPVTFVPDPVQSSPSWLAYTPYTFRNYYVNIRRVGSFDEYLKTFSPKSRSTLRRKLKKFAAASGGAVHWREFARPEEIDEFAALAGAVSSKSYQERLLGTGLPRTPQFVTHLASLAQSSRVLGYILFMHGRAVAYACCLRDGAIATYDYVGYDPDARTLSPGAVLQYLILQRLFERGDVATFDFTEGEGELKRLFSTDACVCAKTYFFRPSFETTALINLHYRLNGFVETVGRVVDELGLKSRLRKFIRRVA
jgi:CelD/BcsL family acetyltransferase involved in cellulose biosynthesis